MITKNENHPLFGKRIFVTGHTGFTGSWASIWLQSVGAVIFGYSLVPENEPNLFNACGLGQRVKGTEGDIRDYDAMLNSMQEFAPELVLHLAAQPLVRKSFRESRETFESNSQGTANVLEAACMTESVIGILCITSDKVYKIKPYPHKYVESDEIGGEGKDPYSASKVAAETIISSYRHKISQKRQSLRIAVARGGNIIGGGDWSEDRLIPDFIRAHTSGQVMEIRFPDATRPWQHVLSLVEGYVTILSGLVGESPNNFAKAFNLGPIDTQTYSVKQVLEEILKHVPDVRIKYQEAEIQETQNLELNSNLALNVFGWNPSWSTSEAIRKTAEWYRDHLEEKKSAFELCREQIDDWNEKKRLLTKGIN